MVARMHIAAHTMLGAVKRHQIHLRRLVQDIHRGFQMRIHTGGVGHKAHTFTFQHIESAVAEHFDTKFYSCFGRLLFGLSGARANHHHHQGKKQECAFHCIICFKM